MDKDNHPGSPSISVIVAVYNAASHLPECLDSISRQTLPAEVIVIDGGSTDGTLDIIKFRSAEIDYWISEPDSGIYNAWNKGLAQAKGEWICFLGADDYLWDAQVLERMARELEKIPAGIRVAYGQVMIANANGVSLYPIGEPWQKIKARFKQAMCIPHPGAMHRRSLFEQRGKFDESFRIAGDYELLLRELKSADAFFIQDCMVAGMRVGGMSSDPANSLLQLHEVRRAQRMHGRYFPGRIWLMAMMRVYLRLLLWGMLGERLARKALDLGRRMMGLPPFWTMT